MPDGCSVIQPWASFSFIKMEVNQMSGVNRNMTMLQLFEQFNEAISQIDKLKFIIDAMKRAPDLESVSYTANDENVLIGEVYYIKSVGNYVIQSSGKGKVSYIFLFCVLSWRLV